MPKWVEGSRKEYDRARYLANREFLIAQSGARAARRRSEGREFLEQYKSSNPCVDCGRIFPAVCMDFDHLHSKRMAISMMLSKGYSIPKILEEASKCELVCSNCHRIRTDNRRQATVAQ